MVWNFALYLLYGLAFFTLGVAILSRDTRLSELGYSGPPMALTPTTRLWMSLVTLTPTWKSKA